MTKSLPPLYPLSIPQGWVVRFHELRTIDPQKLDNENLDWKLLSEDLIQIEHEATGILLDVGWYPDASPSGHFKLMLIQGTDWTSPLWEFRTYSLNEIVSTIEKTLVNTDILKSAIVKPQLTLTDLSTILDESPDINEVLSAVRLLTENYSEQAIPLLIERLTDPRPRVRYAAVDALRRIGNPSVGEALHNRFLLPEPDLDTRRLLLRALGAVGYTPAIPTLISWLQNPDAQQRAAAAWSLGTFKAKEALPALTDAYATERNRPTRDEMRTALHRLARI